MRKLFLYALAVTSVVSPLFADSIAQEYYDRTAWESAAGNALLKDNFNSNSVSLPGVTVASYISYNGLYAGAGHFKNGAWTDSISKYGYTEWTFSQPIYGFGADFQMHVEDGLEFFSGLNLTMPNAIAPFADRGQPRKFDGFYGFISSTPITSLIVSWGNDGPPCGCYGQSYTMDNLEISASPVSAAVPEPAWFLPLGGIMLVLIGGWRRVRNRPNSASFTERGSGQAASDFL